MSVISTELLKAFYLLTLAFSAVACFNLVFNRSGERRIKVAFLVLCSVLSFVPINAYLQLAFGRFSTTLFEMSSLVTWIFGPIVYFSLREISLKPLTKIQFSLHLSPFIIAVILQLFILPESTIYQPRKLGLDVYYFLCLQVFAYLLHATHWLISNTSSAKRVAKNYKNSTYYWFGYLVFSLMGFMIYDVVLINQLRSGVAIAPEILAVIACLLCTFVSSIALFALYQPSLFNFKENDNRKHQQRQNDKNILEKTLKPVELRTVELSKEVADELRNRLVELVIKYQPHLDPDISMSKLSSLLGISNHHLSELLNVHMETNFYEYLNMARHNTAKTLIANSSALSINDIAYQSGFNNRNSFYKVFKENTGLTPAAYRKSLQE